MTKRPPIDQRTRDENGPARHVARQLIKGYMGSDSIEVGGNVTPVAEATITLIEQDRR
jgi:hypothetical protein